MKKIILAALTFLLLAFYTFGQNNSDFLKEFSTSPDPFDKARISYYINSEKLNPNDFEGHYYRGMMNLENGLYEEAIKNFRHVIVPKGNIVGGSEGFAEPYFNIGLCKSMLQEYDSALYYYDLTIEIDPLHSEAHNERGILYMSYGEYELALKEFEDAYLYDAEAMHSYYNIAYINYLMGNEKIARKILKKVMKKFPEYDMSYALSGTMDMEHGKYVQADKKFTKALSLNPFNVFALGNRGLNHINLWFTKKNYYYLDLAYEDMQKVIKLDPTYAKGYSVCSVIDMILDRDEQALENAYMARKILFENPDYYAKTYPIDRLEFSLLSKLYDETYLPAQEKQIATDYLLSALKIKSNKPDDELEKFETKPYLTDFMKQLLLYHYLKTTNIEKATLYLDQLLETDNPQLYLKVIKGLLMLKNKTVDEAQKYLQALAENDSTYAFLHFSVGLNYAADKDYQKAIECFTKAIYIAPLYVRPYHERGRIYDILDDHRAALNDAQTILLIDETDFYAWYLAGRSYNELSEPDSALQCLEFSIIMKPENIYPYLEKEYSYKQKKEFKKASGVLDEYIRVNPYSYLGYLYRGKSKAEYNTKEAFDDLDKAKRMTRENFFVYEAYGDVYYENMQDYRAAIDNYKNAADLWPESSRPFIRIAMSYYYLEEYVSAITYYEKVLEIDSTNVFAVTNLGHSFSKLGNNNKAIEYFVKATEIDSTYTNAVGNAGWTYYLMGEYDKSIEYSVKAVALDSTAYYAMFNHALATLRLGKVDEARALYAKYYDVVKDLEFEKYDGAIEDLKLLVAENNMKEEALAILKDYFGVEM